MAGPSIFDAQLWGVLGASFGMVFGYMIRPWVENLMAPLYTKFVGIGPDGYYTEQKVNNNKVDKGEFQVKDGPIVPINQDTRYTHKKNGMRVVAFNTASGQSLKPKNRIVGLIDNMEAAVIQKGRTVERLMNYLGLPWGLIVVAGLFAFAILVAGAMTLGYFFVTKGG